MIGSCNCPITGVRYAAKYPIYFDSTHGSSFKEIVSNL